MASLTIEGLKEAQEALAKIRENIENVEIATKQLANLMRDYVHVDSGDLQASIDYQENVAYAATIYAGVEEERGGSHAYGTQAIESFDMEAYSDEITRPW